MSNQFPNLQNQIKLEDMAQWHPGIATKYFEEPAACTMLEYGGSPYNLIVDCTKNSYAKCGMVETTVTKLFFKKEKFDQKCAANTDVRNPGGTRVPRHRVRDTGAKRQDG